MELSIFRRQLIPSFFYARVRPTFHQGSRRKERKIALFILHYHQKWKAQGGPYHETSPLPYDDSAGS